MTEEHLYAVAVQKTTVVSGTTGGATYTTIEHFWARDAAHAMELAQNKYGVGGVLAVNKTPLAMRGGE